MLSARRDVSAAKRFFRKVLRADHRRLPSTMGTDKRASYPEAFTVSTKEKVLPADCNLGQVKYLNNVVEQGHRFIRRGLESDAELPLLPHRREGDRGGRSCTPYEEGTSEKTRRPGHGWAGEVRREAVRSRCLSDTTLESLLASE